MIKTCPHCKNDFKSNHARRIYCSDSHRVAAYNKKKGFKVLLIAPEEKKKGLVVKDDKIALSGSIPQNKADYKDSFTKQTAAAVTGNVIANKLINLFTKDENKPATKKDLVNLFYAIQKEQQDYYELIRNQIKEK